MFVCTMFETCSSNVSSIVTSENTVELVSAITETFSNLVVVVVVSGSKYAYNGPKTVFNSVLATLCPFPKL